MRIIIVAAVFPPEPVVSSRTLHELALALSDSHDVTVIRPRPSRPHGFSFESLESDPNIRVIQLGSFVYSRSKFLGRFLESMSFGIHSAIFLIFNARRFDVVYNGAWPLFGQLFVNLVCLFFSKKVLLPVQDIYPEAIENRIPQLFKFLYIILMTVDKVNLKIATRVYTISEKMRRYIAESRKLEAGKIDIIYNWQNTSDFTDIVKNVESSRFTFMFLGNIGKISGIIKLIDLFQKAGCENCDLIIAGNGSLRNEAEEFTRIREIANVHFMDVPPGKVDEIQKMANILVLFTLDNAAIYSVPSKLPSYMMSSKPVLAFVHPDSESSRIINLSDCGWSIDSKSEAEFVEKLRELPELDSCTLDILGNNGRKFARENFSEENLAVLVRVIENM